MRNRILASIALSAALCAAHAQDAEEGFGDPGLAPPATAAPPPAAAPKAAAPEDAALPFTWWNNLPERIRRGNSKYKEGAFERAEDEFRSAGVEDREEPVAWYNLGLAQARQQRSDAAVDSFNRALDLAGEDKRLRADAYFNRGKAQMDAAVRAMQKEKPDKGTAIREALSALDSFSLAGNSGFDFPEAEHNRQQVQHFLQQFAAPPPPQSSSAQSREQNQDQEQQSDDQQQDGQGQPQQQDQQQQQQDQQQQQQEGQQQQQPEEKEGEQENQDEKEQKQEGEEQQQQQQQQQGQGDEKPQEMSAAQAKERLEVLGDPKNIILRKNGRPKQKPHPEKPW